MRQNRKIERLQIMEQKTSFDFCAKNFTVIFHGKTGHSEYIFQLGILLFKLKKEIQNFISKIMNLLSVLKTFLSSLCVPQKVYSLRYTEI